MYVSFGDGFSGFGAGSFPVNGPAEPVSHAGLLLAVAREGDRGAFAALFLHFAPRLKSTLQRAGIAAAAAEEMAQEAMLAVWRKAGQYDPARASAAAWIFAIARNLRIDALRRSRLALPPIDVSDEAAPVPLADAVIVAGERSKRLRAALDRLPPEQLALLQMTYFEERTQSEIEAALGVPLGTVKSRLRLAMGKLRAALKDDA